MSVISETKKRSRGRIKGEVINWGELKREREGETGGKEERERETEKTNTERGIGKGTERHSVLGRI